MAKKCENRMPGTFENCGFVYNGVQKSLCPAASRKYIKLQKHAPRNRVAVNQIWSRKCFEKQQNKRCRKISNVEEKQAQRAPKSEPKALNKVSSSHPPSLMGPLGCPGGARDHFYIDCGSTVDGFEHHFGSFLIFCESQLLDKLHCEGQPFLCFLLILLAIMI